MAITEIDEIQQGANTTYIKDYSVDSKTTDTGSLKETRWTCTRANEFLGYYKQIPELKMAIDTKATWTIGKGFISNPITTLALMRIRGIGNDTFNSILENLIKSYHIYGDSYAEIIRDSEGFLINLKVLDPSKITIIANSKGIITAYEHLNPKGKSTKLNPEQVLHLSKGRVADEIHGISTIEVVEALILARNEAIIDWKKVLHRNVYPVRYWQLDTSDTTKITTVKNNVAEAKYKGEDIFIPKGVVEAELISVPQNASLSSLPWIQQLNQYFFQAVGVPQIILGGSQELTQTAAQIAYLAFEQTIQEEQLFIEDQILAQLNLEIELNFPASLQGGLISSERKDGSQQQQLNKPSTMMPSFEQRGKVHGFK